MVDAHKGKGGHPKNHCWTNQWTKSLLLVAYIHCGSVVYMKRDKRQDQTIHYTSPKLNVQ